MVWSDTYHGAFTMRRRIFDLVRWMRSIFVLGAHPQSWIPYVLIGLMTALYISSVSMDRCDFFPMSQYKCRQETTILCSETGLAEGGH
jgi:hypothetical protein